MLTLREKIMLALLDKKECSRKELAGLCRVMPSQVSRIIKKMIENNVVEKNRRYVIESGRFNDFYSLTVNGVFNAKEIKEKIGNKKIKVKNKGKVIEKRINEINAGVLDVVNNVSNRVFEPEKIRKKFVVSENIPKFRYFFGREKEIDEIKSFLRSESKMLVIKGVAGIGKTTLGAKIASEYNGNIFWYRFNEWTTLQDTIRNIGNFLKKIGKNSLNSYVNSNKKLGIDEISVILEKDLNNVFLFFDDCHHANREVVLFFKSLLSVLDKKYDVKVVMFGRSIPLFYDRRDVVLNKRVKEFELDGLDESSGKKLLKHRKIDDKRIDDILKNLKGHPLFLELASENANYEIEKYLGNEIFAKLGENEKNALGLASVFRYPFPYDVFSENGIDYSVVEGLVEKSLLKPDFFVHDLIKNFVYPRLTREQKIRYHGIAGSYYESNEDWIESMHHFAIANLGRAAEIAAEKGEMLIRNGHVDDFLSILNKLNGHKKQNKLLLLKGDIFDIKGEWDKALECYKKVLKVAEGTKNQKTIAKSYRNIGLIHVHKADYKRAVENLRKALKISELINDIQSMGEVYFLIGKAMWRTGKLDDASTYLNNCLNIAEETGDKPMLSKALMDIGTVYYLKGKYNKTLEYEKRSLGISESLSSKYEIGRAYNNIGVAYAEGFSDYVKAIEWHEKQISLCRKIGDVKHVAYGLSNASYSYAVLNQQLDKAKKYVDEALNIFSKLDEKRAIGQCYSNYGIIYHRKKDWEKSVECFEKAIKIAKAVDNLEGLSQSCFNYAHMLADKGDNINAKKQFKNALKYYEKLGNKEKIREIKNGMSRLAKRNTNIRVKNYVKNAEKGSGKCQKTRIKRKALKNSRKNWKK